MENKLKILFENKDYLIIDKSSGVTVNRSDTTIGELTLQDFIEKEGKIGKNDKDEEFVRRSGIVHRLDKETSGVLIVAKNSQAFRVLQDQFKERDVDKSYIALVHGELRPKLGNISVPVGRLPWNRKRFGVLAGGREAVTFYEVITNYQLPRLPKPGTGGQAITNETLSLVRLFPKTGRTHQIRVHLKYMNHPIFADPLYAGRKTSREDRKILPRVFLHAEKIKFLDPATHSEIEFISELPGELKKFINSLEKVEK